MTKAAGNSPECERSDADTRGVWLTAGALLLGVVVVMLLMIALFNVLMEVHPMHRATDSPFVAERASPPEPRLQVNPAAELQRLREAEQSLLTTYGWVDQEAGIVRIPIERAMEIVAERGLPEWELPGQEQPK